MISPQTIAQIRERTDLVALVSETVRLVRRGRSFLGLCPFHKEKTPSFTVSPERGMFYCFGCKEHGGAIDWMMKLEGHTFPEAARALAERAGITVEDLRSPADQHRAAAAKRDAEDLYVANNLAAVFFEGCLWGGSGQRAVAGAEEALAELRRRGLPDSREAGDAGRALSAFRVGYAPASWDALASFFRTHGISPAVAERAGLLVPRAGGGGGGYYDRFRSRLMFPVLDVVGRVVAFSGRILPAPAGAPSVEREDKPAKYVNSPESPVYTKGSVLFGLYQGRTAMRQAGVAAVVEGNFDVVSLHARGVEIACAPLGTAFTPDQARLLKRYVPEAVLLFDGDEAGRKALRAARPTCLAVGLGARATRLPDGKDPDQLAAEGGQEAVLQLVRGARDLREVLVDELLDGEAWARASSTARLTRVREVAKILAEEEDPVAQSLARAYADRIASRLADGRSHVDLRRLERELLVEVQRRAPAAAAGPLSPPADAVQLAVLGALFDFPGLLDHEESAEATAHLDGAVALACAALARTRDPVAAAQAAPESLRDWALGRAVVPEAPDEEQALRAVVVNGRKLRARASHARGARAAEERRRSPR